jgi:hypothetical protein
MVFSRAAPGTGSGVSTAPDTANQFRRPLSRGQNETPPSAKRRRWNFGQCALTSEMTMTQIALSFKQFSGRLPKRRWDADNGRNIRYRAA